MPSFVRIVVLLGCLFAISTCTNAQSLNEAFSDASKLLGDFIYLSNDKFADEIGLSTEQRSHIHSQKISFIIKRAELFRKTGWSKPANIGELEKLVTDTRTNVYEELFPFQVERLRELEFRGMVQADGLDGGILHPEIKSFLSVTGPQTNEILKGVKEAESDIAELLNLHQEQARRLRNDALNEVLKVLDESQRKTLRALAGELDYNDVGDKETKYRIRAFRLNRKVLQEK